MNKKYQPKYKPRARMNHQIRVPEIRLIDETGENLGVRSTQEAMKMADEKGLDLIEIAPQANPPVCKIIDYGKYQYQQDKKEKTNKKKESKTSIKGIRISFRIGQHDLDFKAKQAGKFLEKGCKIKIEMILKGREKSFYEEAKEKLNEFIDSISPDAKKEGEIKKYPRGLTVIVGKQED